MFDLEKLKDNNAIFWIFRFPELRKVAAECGWALGVHGSVVHDLDLMAMPWTEEHTTADELAKRLSEVADNYGREYVKDAKSKPNGRVVYTIFAGDTYIDLNVIGSESSTHRDITPTEPKELVYLRNKVAARLEEVGRYPDHFHTSARTMKDMLKDILDAVNMIKIK